MVVGKIAWFNFENDFSTLNLLFDFVTKWWNLILALENWLGDWNEIKDHGDKELNIFGFSDKMPIRNVDFLSSLMS